MPTITSAPWGPTPYGETTRFTLTNAGGNSVSVLDWGGILQSLRFAGAEMLLNHDRIGPYIDNYGYFGALIGRYGNRIADAHFTLDGTAHRLTPNDNGNQLHGGPRGFDKYHWRATHDTTHYSARLHLSHDSPDGDMGFPGRLSVRVTYEWTNDNALRIHYQATTDQPTLVNLTNHAYFNIGDAPTILDQEVTILADDYVPIADGGIPLGHLAPVAGGPFDFRQPKRAGRDIAADDEQIRRVGGYDHTFAVRDYDGSLRPCATVTDPASGRTLRCRTTEPGVQFWTANFPESALTHAGLCLETQHFPDSPNQPAFATPVLRPGQTYRSTTEYRFGNTAADA